MLTAKERIQQAAVTCRVALSVNFEAQLEALAIIEIDEDAEPLGFRIEGNIAHLKIRGLLAPNVGGDYIEWGLTGYDVLVDYITAADEAEAVEELWLDVDSDGGFAEGIGAVVAALENFSKPIRTFVTGNMNSAAYHIGCAGNPIVATNELSLIGSIGAYAVHTEYASAYQRDGITKRLFKSDFWKGAFNHFNPLSDREAERLQQEVDETADRFRGVVANYRNLTVDEIKGFDGDHFRANEALTIKLIDEIGDLPMSTATSAPGSQPETTAAAPAAPATYSQADLDKAVKDAADAATAKAEAKTARTAEIMAHANGTAALKEQFANDPLFADVPMDKVKAALDASTPTPAEILDQVGGAGVQTDRNEPPSTSETPADKAAKQAEAVEKIKASANKVKVL